MGKLTANQVKSLVEAGTYEDGDGLRLLVKPESTARNARDLSSCHFIETRKSLL